MKCEECLPIIEDYIDGELEAQAANLVSSHVAGCPACAEFYEELKREQGIYAHYRRDIDVTTEMWAAVQARIKQEQPARPPRPTPGLFARLAGLFAAPRLSPALAAALVLITIGITVLVMKLADKPAPATGPDVVAKKAGGDGDKLSPGPRSSVDPARNETATSAGSGDEKNGAAVDQGNRGGGSEALQASQRGSLKRVTPKRDTSDQLSPDRLIRDAEQKYQAAIAILSRDVKRNRSRLGPETLAQFDNTLLEIDRAIAATRRAARENPNDPTALRYMLAAYAKKVDVLREMAGN